MRRFPLPPAAAGLVAALDQLRQHYELSAPTFTLDGNLPGDLGEAIAAELFGIPIGKRNITDITAMRRTIVPFRARSRRAVEVLHSGW